MQRKRIYSVFNWILYDRCNKLGCKIVNKIYIIDEEMRQLWDKRRVLAVNS